MRLLYSAKTADDFAYLPELGEMASLPRRRMEASTSICT